MDQQEIRPEDNYTVTAADVNIRKAAEYDVYEETEQQRKRLTLRSLLKRLLGLSAAAIVFGVIAAAAFQGISWYQNREEGKGAVVSPPISEIGISDAADEKELAEAAQTAEQTTVTDVSGVVSQVMPAIVAIRCEAVTTSIDIFGREFENTEHTASSGTGIIIGQSDSEVLIVTNNHVIDGAVKVDIIFCNDTVAEATVKGTEESNDLAVLSVHLSDLSNETMKDIRIATLGDSDAAKMGDMVIAIGNALGYGQSTTVGYISALNREVTVDGAALNLIQVDAAINPGNSGGALLNANGEVIGINSVKTTATQVEGIGYAIPISEVIPIINELMNREELADADKAYLGIVGKNIDISYSQSFHMPTGIYVYNIGEGTPAQAAGLHQGDIIVGINGRPLSTMEELQTVLGYTRGNTEVTLQLKVLENGSYVDRELSVVLGFRPED